jgi:RNA polymerase-binding transcription factor DksA
MTSTTDATTALSPTELDELRVELDRRRDVAAHSLAILTTGEVDDADQAIAVTEQELTEIDAAIERLASGEYGSCSACGNLVATARLLALPLTRRCIRCADG